MRRRGFLTLAGATLAATLRSDRARAQPPMCPTVVTHAVYRSPEGARIPADGGVLVGLTFDFVQSPASPDVHEAYVFTHADRERAAHRTELAPGLTRLTFGDATGPVSVRGPAGARRFELVGTRGALPPPPHVQSIRMRPLTAQFDIPGGATAEVTLRDPVPRGVVGMIAYQEIAPRPEATRPRALCFALVREGERSLPLFRPRTHCDGNVPGEGTIYAGLTLRIAYVDATGCVSNQSNHVVVAD